MELDNKKLEKPDIKEVINQPVNQVILPGMDFITDLTDDTILTDSFPKLTPKVIKEGNVIKNVELPICAIVECSFKMNKKPDAEGDFKGITRGHGYIVFEGLKRHKEEVPARYNLKLQIDNPKRVSKDGKHELGKGEINRVGRILVHVYTTLGGNQDDFKTVMDKVGVETYNIALANGWIKDNQIIDAANYYNFYQCKRLEYAFELINSMLTINITGEDQYGNAANRKYVRLHIKVADKGEFFEVDASPFSNVCNFIELYKKDVPASLKYNPKFNYEITSKPKPMLGGNQMGMPNGLPELGGLPNLDGIQL